MREEQKPAAVAVPSQETCQTCQGNGEVVTDWERYKHPLPGDVGDEAVAECQDCDGQGTVAAAPTTQAAPQQAAQEPCPTCVALARTVMLDQVSFDRKPDCYGIRRITDDEGVEEWEDIRTSPDVAREEANDMMATGRGETYEVVPLYTAPQPAPVAQGDAPKDGERCQHCIDRHDGFYGSYAPDCPFHDYDGKPRAQAKEGQSHD